MVNVYMILNRTNGKKYIGISTLPLNKVWKQTLSEYEQGNTPLYNTMKSVGSDNFTIKIIEEYYGKDIDDRLLYWLDKHQPEYNSDHIPYVIKPNPRKNKTKRRWGIQRKHKPKGASEMIVLKCRNLKTGKLKTIHGWKNAVKYIGGAACASNIARSIKKDTTAYGHKWWVVKKPKLVRKVYGVNREGDSTCVYESIAAACLSFGIEDKGKGICTSIKWGKTWMGYFWHYADLED